MASSVSSRHSGGVNGAMMDGSVRFFKNTINNNTWWALGTKANNEVIEEGRAAGHREATVYHGPLD